MKQKLGIGSLSLLLAFAGIAWSMNFPVHYDTFCIGDYVLNQLNLPTWSNGSMGTHYTVFWGLLLYLPGFLLGNKYSQHLFARSGKWLCGCIAVCLIVMGTAFGLWG